MGSRLNIQWSLYRTYAGYEPGPAWLTAGEILRRSAGKVAERNRSYRSRLRQILSQGVDASGPERFRDVVGIGSAPFIERIKKQTGEGCRETERRGPLRARVVFEEVVRTMKALQGEPRSSWLHLHGDGRKWMVRKLARQYTGMTLAQLGEAMGGMDYAVVGMRLRRFEPRLQKQRALRKTYRQAKNMFDVKTLSALRKA